MNQTSIFEWALKLAPLLLGGNQTQREEVKPVLDDKDVALITLRQKAGSVIIVLGSRDTGKTELCYRIAEFLQRPVYAVSPQQKPPNWIHWIKEPGNLFKTVPTDSTLIMDDVPSYLGNRDYNEDFSRAMEKIVPMVRHEPNPPDFPIGQVHLIFASQSAAQADRYILDCDMAFLKPLGLLMQDIERPAIAKIYRTMVDPEFEGKNDDFIKSHAYMLSRTFKGIISFKMAT